ncbi:hypothetical protein AGR1B_Cc120482 [Agrobacterium fabacearum S56]|nr:hypothetical protein AGR1B_Cc120482 [Agrobacterium fabacearum S56]
MSKEQLYKTLNLASDSQPIIIDVVIDYYVC